MFLRSSNLASFLFANTKRCCNHRHALASRRSQRHHSSSHINNNAATSCSRTALIFDTETTGLVDLSKPAHDPNQPHLMQLGMIWVDLSSGDFCQQQYQCRRLMQVSYLVQLGHDVTVSPHAQQVHGISAEDCLRFGVSATQVAQLFYDTAQRADFLVAHNLAFDAKVMEAFVHRQLGIQVDYSPTCNNQALTQQEQQQRLCTMQLSTPIVKLPKNKAGGYKWPSLQQAYAHFQCGDAASTECQINEAHDAMADAQACLVVLQGLMEAGALDGFSSPPKQQHDQAHTGANQAFQNILVVDNQPAANATKSTPSSTSAVPSNTTAKPGELEIHLTQNGGFDVRGNTYKYKEQLKEWGARWNHSDKAWVFHSQAMLGQVQNLAGTNSA